MILHDQHVHSEYSQDSNELLENYIKLAIENGQDYFVVTDHLDYDMAITHIDWLADYKKERIHLNELQNKYPNIRLMEGIEVGYKEHKLTQIYNVLSETKFSLINLSIHDYKEFDFYVREIYEKYSIDYLLNLYFDLAIKAVKTFKDFDVFCHFDYAFKSAIKVDPSLKINKYEDKLIELFKEIIKRDKALEINTKVQEFIKSKDHLLYVLNLYKKLGGKNLTLSSDAHVLKRYKSSFDIMLPIIKEAGFDHLVYFVDRNRFEYKI